MFVSTAYLMSYILLIGLISLVLSNSSMNGNTHCSKLMITWFQTSIGFYLLALLVCCVVVVLIKRHGFQIETVNFGDVDFVFQVYNRNLVYMILCLVDLTHLGITIWGTILIS